MLEQDWIWQPNSAAFKPQYVVHDPVFGKQSHTYGSPYWMFDITLPPKHEKDRREIAAFFAKNRGVGVVNVYDPRVLVPARYHNLRDANNLTSIVPDIIVKAVNKTQSTITISGVPGDVVTTDDPMAFTHANIRYYFRALGTTELTGADQDIEVYLQPRTDIAGINITIDRIKPRCRFLVRINDTGGMTSSDSLTDFKLSGIEFTKEIVS